MSRRTHSMLVYYRVWEVVLAALALFVGVIAYREYSGAVDATWRRADGDTAAYASALSARAAVATQQITRMKAAMEIALSDPPKVSPRLSTGLRDIGPADDHPEGVYWRSDDADQVVEFLSDRNVRTRLADPETAATLDLARTFAAERRSNAQLFRGLYVSYRQPLLITSSSRAESLLDKSFNAMWNDDRRRTIANLIGEVQRNFVSEFNGTTGDIHWLNPYVGELVKAVQVGQIARVRLHGTSIGVLGTTFEADTLVDVPNRSGAPLGGLTYLFDPRGQILEIGHGPLSLHKELPTALRTIAYQTVAADGRPLVHDGRRFVAQPIIGTPWSVLVITEENAARNAILPGFAIYGALLALVILTLGASLLLFRRGFLDPALQLIEQASSPDSGPIAPATSRIWRPWAEMLDASRMRGARDMEALASQSRLTRSIVDSAIDGVITSDADGRITNFNPAAERMFGWRRDEVVGRTMEETIVPPDLRHRHREGMARHIASGDVLPPGLVFELRGLRQGGEEFPMELAIAEAAQGEQRTFIGYLRDLSQRKADEAEMTEARDARHQSEKLAALGQLLAGVAHELNNPLAIVVGRAALLEEQLADSPHEPSLRKLREAANRCSRIVKTFLSMARQTGPRRGAVQVNDLVEGAVDMVAYGLRNAQIGLTTALDPLVPLIDADEDQLVQVLINLIVNAQHALEDGPEPRQLHITTNYRKAAGQVLIEVTDNGPGVPEAVADRIFDPFFTTKEVGAGTGLGLSVSRNIIEGHGGEIGLVTSPGGGATFCVVLPVGNVAAEPGTAIPLQVENARGVALVVDDEPEVAAMLVDCLSPLGLACITASDGQSALARLSQSPVDIVFCDIRMPGMDGAEFLKRLTADHPEIADRVVFVSGDVLHRDFDRLSLGNQTIIEKPFDPSLIRETASRILADARTVQ